MTQAGYTTFHATTLQDAQSLLHQHNIDLMLLDIYLPDGNGVAFAKKLEIPVKIIFVSAIDDEQTIIDSFHLGSDDYITKPFRLPILLARVQAVIKRYQLDSKSQFVTLGHLMIDPQQKLVFKDKQEIAFTRNEHRLFFYLYANLGQILTREQLLAHLWDSQGAFVNDNTLTVTLKRMRQKIESDTVQIQTKRGVGYRLIVTNEVNK